MIAVFPGSFDPITYGHLNIIERCSNIFDHLVVAVNQSDDKDFLFNIDERVEMIENLTQKCDKIVVDSFDGLLVDYVKKIDADLIVRGLRSGSDFDYERQMALANKALDPSIESFFLMDSVDSSFISSSLVKEIALYKGDLTNFVPKSVEEKLEEKYRGRQWT